MTVQNPPAFPLAIQAEGSDSSYTETYHDGMTLQDYFAAKALTGLIIAGQTERLAESAYKIADEMLTLRSKM